VKRGVCYHELSSLCYHLIDIMSLAQCACSYLRSPR